MSGEGRAPEAARAALVANPGRKRRDVLYVPPLMVDRQLVCPACAFLLDDACTLPCAHVVCLLDALGRGGHPRCPIEDCEQLVLKRPPALPAEHPVRRGLAALRVYCANRARGCAWEGPHGELAAHLGSACAKVACASASRVRVRGHHCASVHARVQRQEGGGLLCISLLQARRQTALLRRLRLRRRGVPGHALAAGGRRPERRRSR